MSDQQELVRFINPPTMARPVGYSHIAEVTGGRMVYIAGQVALDREGRLVGEGDLRAQTEQVFANLQAALEAVSTDFNHVVKFGIFLLDFSQVQAVREVRDRYVNLEHPPASTAVEVRRLFREGVLIEIDAVAVVPA